MKIIIMAFLCLAAFFILYPEADIITSNMLYDAERGGFWLKNNVVISFIHNAVPWIVYIVITCLLTVLLYCLYHRFKNSKFEKAPLRVLLFLMVSLVLGPGLTVNTVFKDNWGRARPSQVMEFGGLKQFTPAFIKTDQCERNCSFVSGHASVGFYFLSFAMLFKGKTRMSLSLSSILLGSVIGFGRIAEGGHFLSDVIFSGFFVYFVARIAHTVIYRKSFVKLKSVIFQKQI